MYGFKTYETPGPFFRTSPGLGAEKGRQRRARPPHPERFGHSRVRPTHGGAKDERLGRHWIPVELSDMMSLTRRYVITCVYIRSSDSSASICCVCFVKYVSSELSGEKSVGPALRRPMPFRWRGGALARQGGALNAAHAMQRDVAGCAPLEELTCPADYSPITSSPTA